LQTGAPATPPQDPVPPVATTPAPSRIIGPTLPALPSTGAIGAPVQAPGLIIGVPPGGGFPLTISPRLPPPSTIPAGPSVILPAPPPSGQARAGKLLDFRPTLQLSEEWTDNFNLSESNKVSNFRTSIIPGVHALLDSGPVTGSGAYNLTAFHDSSLGEFGVQNSVAGLLSWQALPTWRLTLSEAFLQSDDPERSDRLLLTRARRDVTTNQTALTSDYNLLALGLDTRQYYRLSQFSADTSTTSHAFGLSASRALDRIHAVSAGYEYLMSESRRSRTAVATTGSRDSSISGHQFTASFSRDISARTTAGITGTYATRDRDAATGPSSFDRWSILLFNNYTLQERLLLRGSIGVSQISTRNEPLLTSTSNISYWMGPATLSVGIERGFSETFGETEDFGVVETTALLASLLYRFSPLLTGQASAQYRENEVTGIEGTAGGVNPRGDTTYSFGLTLTYLITRGITASLEATHTESEGRSSRSFNENRIRAAVGATLY
jgi:hypothetical protein